MRRALLIIVTISLIVLLSLPSTWQFIYDFFPEVSVETSQMSFKSLFGDYIVSVDNEKLGEVKDKDSQVFTKIKAGNRQIKIVRKSDIPNFYYTFEKKLDFLPNTQVDIEWESGPTLESSNGIVRYFNEIDNDKGTELQIITYPTNTKVEINTTDVKGNLAVITKNEPVKVIVKGDESYEPKELEVKYNSVRKNIRNTVEVYLYKKPFIQ